VAAGTKSCTRCNSGYFYFSDNFTCIAECPEGYYPDDTTDVNAPVCVKCIEECNQCTDATTCQSCNDGFFLEGTTCSNTCSDGLYPDEDTNECLSCHVGCYTCFGALSSECFTCKGDYYLDKEVAGSSCVK
jgi:hypothetical protein